VHPDERGLQDLTFDPLRDELTAHLKSVTIKSSWHWLRDDNGKLSGPSLEFIRDCLVFVHTSAVLVDLPSDHHQLCEGNVDIGMVIPLLLRHLNSKYLVHGTKEQRHLGFHALESIKAVVSQSGVPPCFYKVDHQVQLVAANRQGAACFVTAESKQKDSPMAGKVDTLKGHECAKAELQMVDMSKAPAHKALAEDMTVYSCYCAGIKDWIKMTVYSYRRTHNMTACEVLFEYEIPCTHNALQQFVSIPLMEEKFNSMMRGLLCSLQLKHALEKQARAFKDANFQRQHDTGAYDTSAYSQAGYSPGRGSKSSQGSKSGKGSKSGRSSRSKSTGEGSDGQSAADGGTGGTGGNGAGKAPSDQVRDGLAKGNLTVVVELVKQRENGSCVYLGYAYQPGERPFPVVVKYVGDEGFQAEAHRLQAAAALDPGGVVGPYGFTNSRCAIYQLNLPDLNYIETGAGVILMPRGESWTPPPNDPLAFVRQLCELGETLAKLAAAGLLHQDFRRYNVVVWQGKVRLIDFGFATWRQDCLNFDVMLCRYNPMQAPELANGTHGGHIGEPQVVFTLGSFLVDVMSEYVEEALGGERVRPKATALLRQLSKVNASEARETLPPALAVGLPLVLEVLAPLLAPKISARPSLEQGVKMVQQLAVDWAAALELHQMAATDVSELEPLEPKQAAQQKRAPGPGAGPQDKAPKTRVPLSNVNKGAAPAVAP